MTELVYGLHSVKSILEENPYKIVKIYVFSGPRSVRLTVLLNQIKKYNIIFQECSRHYLNSKSKKAIHQGIIAEIQSSSYLKEDYLLKFLFTGNVMPLFLILDRITDPHNLGACLRSAYAAGVHIVIVPRNQSAHINSTVRKVSSGAAERIPVVQVVNLSRTLQLLKKHNIWIIGTVINAGRIIFNTKLTGALAVIVGSEGSGIRQLIKKNCDELVNIPMIQSHSSLNVSVATGICLFEILRQRQYQK